MAKGLQRLADMADGYAAQCEAGGRAYCRSSFTKIDDPKLRQILLDNRQLIKRHVQPTVDPHLTIFLRALASELRELHNNHEADITKGADDG